MSALGDGRFFVGGQWCSSSSGETLPVVDVSTLEQVGVIGRGRAEDIDLAVKAARAAMDGEWGAMTALERGRLMTRLGRLILDNEDRLAALETTDVGKPLGQSRADVVACARYFEFYGASADKVHGETIPYLDGYMVATVYEPHGVTGHIIPWNYPMQIIGRSVAAALAMGNAAVIKPAEDASQTALCLAELAAEAGFPPGAVNVVTGLGAEAGAALSAHPGVDYISFTGSTRTGALVQKAAADHLAPVALELGGKSPQIVFADADLETALPFLVRGGIQNTGQTCSSGSRLLIEDSIFDKVTGMVADAFGKLRAGPAKDDLDCGPIINRAQFERVRAYLDLARKDGLDVLGEGEIADAGSGGLYVKPTFIGETPPDHPLAQEEIFGPVIVAIRFKDEDEAVRIANGTPYGLIGSVWTRDGARQLRVARRLRAGQVFINNYGAGGGVELPFGGVGMSGHGREKGFSTLTHFATLKTLAIKHG